MLRGPQGEGKKRGTEEGAGECEGRVQAGDLRGQGSYLPTTLTCCLPATWHIGLSLLFPCQCV